ncbi:unnamed protein product [Cochlearia groenlandica]
MKETQIPRKILARFSESGSKRIKDYETTKNQKVTEKRQSSSFSELSIESTKDPIEFAPISQISDSEAESIVIQGSSQDLISTPEICLLTDESPVSTITGVEAIDRVKSISELPDSAQSLREEIRDLKNLIYSVGSYGESNRIHGNVTMKLRVVLSSFILWVILALILIFFFRLGDEVTYYGPVPT